MAGVWTNNYKGYKSAAVLGYTKDGWSTVLNVNGTAIGDFAGPHIWSPLNQLSNGAYGGVRLGSGQGVTPAATDINLNAPIGSNVAYVAQSVTAVTYDAETYTASRSYSMTVRNNNSAPVTITEYGLFWLADDTPTSASASRHALMYHGTFDSPITLNQYDTAILELTVSITLDELV